MHTLSSVPDFQLLYFPPFSITNSNRNNSYFSYRYDCSLPSTDPITHGIASSKHFLFHCKLKPSFHLCSSGRAADYLDDSGGDFCDSEEEEEKDGIETKIEDIGENSRRIQSRVRINATLDAIWNVLTDYEKLADFIPGLAVNQLLEKGANFARLLQIGRQNLPFGLKFDARGVVDCYERDLKCLPFGQSRDIDFKMIDGDFQIFEGKWSIEQLNNETGEGRDSLPGQGFHATLLYEVVVKPKLWLPVGLVEGRLSREIEVNLSCVREEAEKAMQQV